MIYICGNCGYETTQAPMEIPWVSLDRCPQCDAYVWEPPPIRTTSFTPPEADKPEATP